jgi:hypothetical protein
MDGPDGLVGIPLDGPQGPVGIPLDPLDGTGGHGRLQTQPDQLDPDGGRPGAWAAASSDGSSEVTPLMSCSVLTLVCFRFPYWGLT